jgi:hypothetical protein
MQLLHHAQNPTSRFNTYLVWPRLNILVIDMSLLIPQNLKVKTLPGMAKSGN